MGAELPTIVLILSAAAFVQSVSGFGMALVAMAALPLVMDIETAIALVAIFNVFVSLSTMLFNRRGLSWGKAWPLVAGVACGVPIGFWGLKELDSAEVLLRVLGAVLIVLALVEITFARQKHLVLPRWAAFPCALFGGTIGGAFNTGGPPIVAYVYSQEWSKTQIVASLQVTFITGGLLRNVLMGAAGDHTRERWITVAWCLGPALVAVWLGKVVLGKIRLQWLRVGVFVFLLVMGLKYLISP